MKTKTATAALVVLLLVGLPLLASDSWGFPRLPSLFDRSAVDVEPIDGDVTILPDGSLLVFGHENVAAFTHPDRPAANCRNPMTCARSGMYYCATLDTGPEAVETMHFQMNSATPCTIICEGGKTARLTCSIDGGPIHPEPCPNECADCYVGPRPPYCDTDPGSEA